MTHSKRACKKLAEIKSKLPKYCTVRKRKGYFAVYYQMPDHIRPDGWKSAIPIGNTRDHTLAEIIERGEGYYQEYLEGKIGISKNQVRKGSLSYIIARYKKSEHWTVLKPDTRRGYEDLLRKIHEWSEQSGHPHIKLLTVPTIVEFLSIWKNKQRTRKNYRSILSKLYQVAIDEGYAQENLMRHIKLPKAQKKKYTYKVWTREDVLHFVECADKLGCPNVGTAVIVAWEAFRQTDVFRLQEPRDYCKGGFRFNTSKTDEEITVRASKLTQERLSKRPRTQLLLTVNDHSQRPWNKNSFKHFFNKVRKEAKLDGYVFRHIRNSAAINALKADLTSAEFKQRFGWSRKQVETMRDHYTDIDQDIIDTGADKLEALYESNV